MTLFGTNWSTSSTEAKLDKKMSDTDSAIKIIGEKKILK